MAKRLIPLRNRRGMIRHTITLDDGLRGVLRTPLGTPYNMTLFNISQRGLGVVAKGILDAIPVAPVQLVVIDPLSENVLDLEASLCWSEKLAGMTFMGLTLHEELIGRGSFVEAYLATS